MPKGFHHSEETKRKLSLIFKGRPLSDEQKKKISLTKTQDINKRFWSKVDIGDFFECWNYASYINKHGYGQFWCLPKGQNQSHRMAWILTYGVIPDNICVLHKCDNPSCCNPAHLFLGTSKENSQDMVNKGRQAKGSESGQAKLTEKQVIEIRELANNGKYQRQIAKLYGISKTSVWNIIHRKAWKYI